VVAGLGAAASGMTRAPGACIAQAMAPRLCRGGLARRLAWVRLAMACPVTYAGCAGRPCRRRHTWPSAQGP